jgi:gliding motility-associated-like protein
MTNRIAALFTLLACFSLPLNAQQGLCKGALGDNVFKKGDFGVGEANTLATDPGIAPGYRYSNSAPPNDGLYIIANNTTNWGSFAAGGWVKTKDRSADPNGYFMVVNASLQPGLFFRDSVVVCGNTTYQFSADVINLMLPNHPVVSIKPNISFLVDGKEVYTSGDVPQDGQWRTYGFSFTSPPNATKIVLSLRNNAPGGQGNDLGLDNISFQPCGPKITLNSLNKICASDFVDLKPIIDVENPKSLSYQWQKSEDQGLTWNNIQGATEINHRAEKPREGQSYRIMAAASALQLSNPVCTYFSPTTIVEQKRSPKLEQRIICPGGSVTINGQVFRDSGQFKIVLKTPQGCDSLVTYQINMENWSRYRIQGDSIICPENNSVLIAGDFAQYRWSTGATTSSISVESPGRFSVSVTSKNGCPASHSLLIQAKELQGVMEKIDPTCALGKNGQITISQVSGVNRPLTYTLNGKDFQSSNVFKGLSAGTYRAGVQASPACKLTRTLTLENPRPFKLENLDDFQIKQFDSLQLFPRGNDPINFYRWSPREGLNCVNCAEPFARPLKNTRYQVLAISDKGCADSTQSSITVIPRLNTFAPNVFSPNRDGVNDFFTLYCDKGIAKIRLLVLTDRWGNEVFKVSNALPNSNETQWNGISKGKWLSQGVFLWRAELEYYDGEQKRLSGEVMLMR